MTHANVEVRMTIRQFAEAMDVVARRRSPNTYAAMTMIGVAAALFFAWSTLTDAPTRFGSHLVVLCPFLVYLVPCVRYRCLALVYRVTMPMVQAMRSLIREHIGAAKPSAA